MIQDDEDEGPGFEPQLEEETEQSLDGHESEPPHEDMRALPPTFQPLTGSDDEASDTQSDFDGYLRNFADLSMAESELDPQMNELDLSFQSVSLSENTSEGIGVSGGSGDDSSESSTTSSST